MAAQALGCFGGYTVIDKVLFNISPTCIKVVV